LVLVWDYLLADKVEEVVVYGYGPEWPAIYFQTGPFQIVDYAPFLGTDDVYSSVWGQIGGKSFFPLSPLSPDSYWVINHSVA